ncbi:MAG: DUF1592 domain-containing protein [Verrucomicrobiota bacterium]
MRILASILLSISIASAAEFDFEKDVRPVLAERCFGCHGPEKQKGKVRLDNLPTEFGAISAAAETWHDALNALQLGEMPPDDEPQPTDAERQAMTGWMNAALKRAIAAKQSTGGKVVIRRLNRAEYQNTMRDLLDLDIDFIRNLPPDALSPDGFQNNGAVLGMSGMQLDQYLETARLAMSKAIVLGPEPEIFEHKQTNIEKDKGKGNYTEVLGRSGVYIGKVKEFPREGDFEIRIKARAQLPNDKSAFPAMKIDLGYLADTQRPSRELARISVNSEEFQEYVVRGRLEEFPIQSKEHAKYPGMLFWIRNTYEDGKNFKEEKTVEKPNPKNPKKKIKETVWTPDPDYPHVVIESFEFKGPLFDHWPPARHQAIIPDPESPEAKSVIAGFLKRAYRRPPTEFEVDALVDFYDNVRPGFETFEEAMRETLAMALISPEFLYLVEPGSGNEERTLNQYELASRLSYFLWSSMPDDALFDLAAAGKLSDPKMLQEQVTRMLTDPKSRRFVEQFSDQWLDLAQLDRVAVNPEYYPDFNNDLKSWMRAETHAFVAEVLDHNLSALNFLDSEFVMLNEPLARHYGLNEGPRANDFERVALPTVSRRGGLLTMGSTLLGASTGEDSHPIKRAVWLRERLLHDPPAPPPPNVPELDAEDPNFAKLPVREQLEIHAKDPACNDCHRGIDPWGIAMEQFDAVGLFREEIRRKNGKRFVSQPVISKDTLPDGHEVDGIEQLKVYLLDRRKDQFAHALTTKLLSYGLGRTLELTDEPAVEAIAHDFAAADYQLKDLIQLVVASEPFHTK